MRNYICIVNFKTNSMKLDKKILYRHIVMLQMFACCYRAFQHHLTDGTCMFEVTKLYKDKLGNTNKVISFALSKESLPVFLDCDPVTNYDVTLLSDSQIKNYVSQCKSYGIEL